MSTASRTPMVSSAPPLAHRDARHGPSLQEMERKHNSPSPPMLVDDVDPHVRKRERSIDLTDEDPFPRDRVNVNMTRHQPTADPLRQRGGAWQPNTPPSPFLSRPALYENGGHDGLRLRTPSKVTGLDSNALRRMLISEHIIAPHPHHWPMNKAGTAVSFRVDDDRSSWYKLCITLYQNGSIHFQGPIPIATAATDRLLALKGGDLHRGPTNGSPLPPRRQSRTSRPSTLL